MRKISCEPLLSVIVPIFNTEEYLNECLESIVNQTYRNLEIILVNDGSTDGSGEIADNYVQKDKRIKLIHQTNHGESHARNTGLRIATGDYITFVDCDDWIDTDMYESLMSKTYDGQVDIVACSWYKEYLDRSEEITNISKVKDGIFNQTDLMHYIYRRDEYRGFAYMWDKIYKRKLIYNKDNEPYVFNEFLKLGGDVIYLGQMILNAKNATYIDKSLYHYRQRDDSGCHAPKIGNRLDWLKSYQILIDMFENACADDETMTYIKRFLAYHAAETAELALKNNEYDAYNICKKLMGEYNEEYTTTNKEYPDRLEWYRNLMNNN